ncbi:hypothetical protein FB45DRAFT_983874 [Roridomyces roridus]|uniref:CxC2-like cysteine cluster KDZ transposase-associated domain-containing protein n=1 Tax=Roridomyces roridus TaxID=1738132 RepID=A0AAD7AY87_9AGAR|nr:hypothetical protein FB45DRAFT_983874 [Roridomyces roridus]
MFGSRKKRGGAPPMVVGGGGNVSHISFASQGSSSRHRTIHAIVTQGASSGRAAARTWSEEEDLATQSARDDPLFTYSLGDRSLSSQVENENALDDGIVVQVEPTRNFNSEYLEEDLRREGRGAPKVYSSCTTRGCTEPAVFRCVDAACFGEVMHCPGCIVRAHATLPTHFVEKWDGARFVRKRTWLRDLGLRVQLGHPPGVVCPFKTTADVDFILYDLSGVHEIAVDFCGCRTTPDKETGELHPLHRRQQLLRACWWPATVRRPNTCATFAVLRFFLVLNCLGKVSAYDFLRALERCTNNNGLEKIPNRRKPFMQIIRQRREVKKMKRGKRGHSKGGVRATGQGELALKCRACPQPGWNLPPGYENMDPAYNTRYIFFLFLAQDANFRLSNRSVSTEAVDPIWDDGCGYFCKREGEDGYKAHIEKNANEQEISNCSGFQAMFMANTRRVKGLRTTGVAGVTCSRHNMWRPNGLGDLQVGERQCNMDFILVSAILNFSIFCLIISYDIACQYAIHFWERMEHMPDTLRPKIAPEKIWWKVPNFHLPPHKPRCHGPFSFHWMWGAGMTHGETIEQNWAFSNGAAGSTRLMGPGSRHATLEDIFGFHNYDRLLAMHRVLPNRLAVSIKEGSKHRAAFTAFNSGLEALRPEDVRRWREMVIAWESTQHTDPSDDAPCPFEVAEEGAPASITTLREIQLQIAAEELICTDDGVEVEQEHTPGTFITMGLELEELQSSHSRSAAQRCSNGYTSIQRVYMPALRSVLSDVQRQVLDGNGEQLPEATRLFMPSEIVSERKRNQACAIGLSNIEARMRLGELDEALGAVRHGLRTRTMTNRYKLRNWTGQGMMTKGQGILRQISLKIHTAKLRYRYARAALLALQGHGVWEEKFHVLQDDDVRALNERALTVEEKAQNEHWAELGGAIIEGGIDRAAALASGEGSHTLSWIWYSAGSIGAREAEQEDDPQFHDALRLEWCKAYSRSRRFVEEVRLLREEMRRTIAFSQTEGEIWDGLGREEWSDTTPELAEGRRAYAAEQAGTERIRCRVLEANWAGILAKAEEFLAGRTVESSTGIVSLEIELGDELDQEEEEALLEGVDDE